MANERGVGGATARLAVFAMAAGFAVLSSCTRTPDTVTAASQGFGAKAHAADVSTLSGTLDVNSTDGSGGPTSLGSFDHAAVATITISGLIEQTGVNTKGQTTPPAYIGPPGASFDEECLNVAYVEWPGGHSNSGPCPPSGADSPSVVTDVELVQAGQVQALRTAGGTKSGDVTYTYSGSQSVTVTPVSAILTGVANPSAIVGPQSVTFTARITPTTYNGITIPIQIASWNYNGTPACTTNTPTDTLCTITVSQSGSMTIAGEVNGTAQTGQASVAIVTPSISLTASPTQTDTLTPVTFTATVSPAGVTTVVNSWLYFPDPPAGSTQGVGSPQRIAIKGRAVQSVPSSRATAPTAVIHLGTRGRGSWSTPGGRSARSKASGVDGAGCSGLTCVTTLSASGTMWLYVTLNGKPDSASAHVTIVNCPTGDSILDSPGMRQGLMLAWNNSDPTDNNTANRRERGGSLYNENGQLDYILYPDMQDPDTPCSNESNPNTLPPYPTVARFHTHPFHDGANLPFPACSKNGQPSIYDAGEFGGPSWDDWQAANNTGVPQYIMDANWIYVAPPGADSGASNWQQLLKKYPRNMGTCTLP